MEAYQPLFSVSVEHAYFSDGLWKGLDFIPSLATSKVIASANLLVRPTSNGVSVFFDEARTAALRLCANDETGVLHLSFKVRAKERTFAN
jgi:hypothetical protein